MKRYSFELIREQAGEENKQAGGNGGGDDPVASKILGKIDAMKKVHDEITTNLAKLDGEGKKLSEEFAKACKNFEGLGSDVQAVFKSLKALEQKVANVKRYDSGQSAVDVLRRDLELNHLANSIVRGVAAQSARTIKVAVTDEQKKTYREFVERQESAVKALSTGASPGSLAVDDELNTQFYSLIAEYGVWPVFDVMMATKGTTKLITDDSDPTFGFVAENTEPSEGSITGSSASVSAKKGMAWLAVSNELLEDAEYDVASFLLPKFANAAALRADHIAIAADGTDDATDGTFTGLFSGGTAVTLGSGKVTIEDATYEDWLSILLGCSASILSRPTSRWFLHPQMLIRAMALKDDNGRPIFLPSIDAPSFGAFGSILGYPVTLAHAAPNTNTAGNLFAAFGDAKGQALLIRRQFTYAASEHAGFTKDQIVYRATSRMASKTRKALSFAVMKGAAS